ncbi:hypothetical protein B0G69_6364 [Paraburkholderia sp. RAU2J]|uniref:hypothetical protein n=1 Tax=Paraburkholderia sp. RAU2J TaxID=1938810 RepID=UPI000EB3EBCB|nr:hypothetical protein [Paraburkholderia sp. RAU2J]RKT22869.1 hypothetical protein B0G69_6364 [Paraburkholderia sp. RAU2J]
MKYLIKALFASGFAMALSAMTFVKAGESATPGPGAGSVRTPNEGGYGADAKDAGVVVGARANAAAISNPTTRRSNGKMNGLHMGTNSGANSDVNRGFGGASRNGQ